MTRKKIVLSTLLLFSLLIAQQFYVFFGSKKDNLQAIYLIPKDAVYIIKIQKPLNTWAKISDHNIWRHLQNSTYFSELTKSLSTLDSVFKQKKGILNFIGNRNILISAHTYKPKKYSFFYTIDLQKIAKLNILKNNISKFVSNKFNVSNRKYHTHEIIEVYNKESRETLYLSFIKNQLIVSFTHTLIEASIDQYKEPIIGRDLNFLEIKQEIENNKLFEFYFQYKYLPIFANCFLDKKNVFITDFSENLRYSGFHFDLDNDLMIAKGYTNINKTVSPYLKAFYKSGVGQRSTTKISPSKTSAYTSFSFNNFYDFYENFEIILKENPTQFNTYLDGIEKVENLLKINIKENFVSWIGTEIALINLKPFDKNEIALIIKTNSVKNAQKNLAYILKQLKKRTPLKFKRIIYKEHEINYLAIKGFFKIFLGDFFNKIDKPYFTIIDDFVIFSDNPNTLKYIINQYIDNNTLALSKDYQKFDSNFSSKSSIFTYVNTPLLFDNIYSISDLKTRKKMNENSDYINCFSQLGYQLTTNKNIFKSSIFINFKKPKDLKNNPDYSTSPKKTLDNINSKNTTNQETNKESIFLIPEIYPNDLNSKKYVIKYNNGDTKIFVELKNGLKHGKYKEYYPNGTLKISGKYKKGKQIKLWKHYNNKGELIIQKRY